jgi:hypothetical protein
MQFSERLSARSRRAARLPRPGHRSPPGTHLASAELSVEFLGPKISCGIFYELAQAITDDFAHFQQVFENPASEGYRWDLSAAREAESELIGHIGLME